MPTGFKIEGLSETKAALDALPLKMEKRVIRKGLRIGAKVVLNAARSEAPEQSGTVKKNIKIRAGRSAKGTLALSVGVGAKDFKGETFYAGFVLYGHHVGSRKLGDSRRFVEPNDFLTRAYNSSRQGAVEATTGAWSDLLTSEIGK